MRRILLAALLAASGPAHALACEVIDYMTLPLPAGEPLKVAIETAYPGLTIDGEDVVFSEEKKVPLGTVRGDVSPADRLKKATVREQFLYRYPLDFDLEARRQPWFDPGRLRSEDFFRALYGGKESVIRRGLERVVYDGLRVDAGFKVSSRTCAHVQLQAALEEIAALGHRMDKYFERPGGGFAWRRIAGTRRLSAHSFGIAVDIDSTLGQYWRWAGTEMGAVDEYRNKIPEELVAIFERRGFIWGGKWHHYDGMHFEFRPELILYSRLTGG